MVDMARYLKPGSKLPQATPNFNYRAIQEATKARFYQSKVEGVFEGDTQRRSDKALGCGEVFP
jgi:hypothetical protein